MPPKVPDELDVVEVRLEVPKRVQEYLEKNCGINVGIENWYRIQLVGAIRTQLEQTVTPKDASWRGMVDLVRRYLEFAEWRDVNQAMYDGPVKEP